MLIIMDLQKALSLYVSQVFICSQMECIQWTLVIMSTDITSFHYTLLKPKRHELRCHGFVVHVLLLRMHTNVVDFRVMRRLCHREWNWQSVNHIPRIYDNGPRDHGVWHLTLTAYNIRFRLQVLYCFCNPDITKFCYNKPGVNSWVVSIHGGGGGGDAVFNEWTIPQMNRNSCILTPARDDK